METVLYVILWGLAGLIGTAQIALLLVLAQMIRENWK